MKSVKKLIILLLLLSACTDETTAYTPQLIQPVATTIDTAFAEVGNVIQFYRRAGVTRYLSQTVYFDNPTAVFEKFHVLPGEFVTEGQLLATLNSEDLDEQTEYQQELISNMLIDHTLAYELRQIEIDIMVLEHTRNLNQAAFDTSALQIAELNIERARLELNQQLERQNMQLRQAETRLAALQQRPIYLHSPINGRITNMALVIEGQNIPPGMPLVFITEADEVMVEAVNLPAADWPPPPNVPGPRPPSHWIPAPLRTAVYSVGYINGQAIDLQYRELVFYERKPSGIPSPVRFNTVEPIRAGQYVTLHFYTVKLENVLRIPTNALFHNPLEGIAYVYKIVNDELIFAEVELYANTDTFAAIRQGLQEGDEIFVRP